MSQPVADLRDLARKIHQAAEGHFCYGQAAAAIHQLEDYLCAMARCEEHNQEGARLEAEVVRLTSEIQALRTPSFSQS